MPGPQAYIERSIAGIWLCGLYQQIECGLIVQSRRRGELLGLAAELIGNGGLMRTCFSHVGSPGQRLKAQVSLTLRAGI